ncbi:hypothetical protein FRC02_006790 [Tulasnella sp. 418]|nr:hypothetical protein FRC02_006790 [Tulasnella sp. 418]
MARSRKETSATKSASQDTNETEQPVTRHSSRKPIPKNLGISKEELSNMSREEIIAAISGARSEGQTSSGKAKQSASKTGQGQKASKKAQENEAAEANAARVKAAIAKSKAAKASNRVRSSSEPSVRSSPPPRPQIINRRAMPRVPEEDDNDDNDDNDTSAANLDRTPEDNDAADLNDEQSSSGDKERTEPTTISKIGRSRQSGEGKSDSNKKATTVSAKTGTKRKREFIVISEEDEDEDSDEDREESASDDEVPTASKSKRARKAVEANLGPKLSTVAPATAIKRKLGPRRDFLKEQSPFSRSTSSVPPSTASTTSAASANNLNGLPPAMKALTRVAKVRFRVHIAAKNGFPDSTESASIARKIFKEVCDERNAVEEQELFEEDKNIAKSIIKIVSPFL